ncbi:MAG: gamma-glutamyl-gamma-aminobutyrate hydrolase family protein [Rubrivivax sp.]
MAMPPHPAQPRPRVLVSACNKQLGDHPFHAVGRKYVDAVRLAGGLPLIVARAEPWELDEWLDLADGVLLTGSVSNVHPSHFGEAVHDEALPLDPLRDAWTLPLIPKALERGLPLLAICRGTQEANVALGGSLHQAVHEAGPYGDHRASGDDPVEVQYGPAHAVQVQPGGWLQRSGVPMQFQVNSVHGQGLKRLAPGLRVEALAPDGLVEAFSVAAAPAFNLCVQWHPEWQAADNPQSMQILRAFGEALRRYRDRENRLAA